MQISSSVCKRHLIFIADKRDWKKIYLTIFMWKCFAVVASFNICWLFFFRLDFVSFRLNLQIFITIHFTSIQMRCHQNFIEWFRCAIIFILSVVVDVPTQESFERRTWVIIVTCDNTGNCKSLGNIFKFYLIKDENRWSL